MASIISKVKELPENKGNPPAPTLGTTILLTLCNFLIAEDIEMIIRIEVVDLVLLTSVIYSTLPVCAQKNGYGVLEACKSCSCFAWL